MLFNGGWVRDIIWRVLLVAQILEEGRGQLRAADRPVQHQDRRYLPTCDPELLEHARRQPQPMHVRRVRQLFDADDAQAKKLPKNAAEIATSVSDVFCGAGVVLPLS